jgi:anti-sigma regulatory factor (Ser/Thr protein kinase)
MALNGMVCIHIGEMSGVVEALQRARTICEAQGFDATLSDKVAIIVTELATNIVKHAGEGDLLIRPSTEAEVSVIECLALDRGPGILDIGSSLHDGKSSEGSPKKGLKAVRSLSSFFDLYSIPGKGTAIFTRIEKELPAPLSCSPHPLRFSRFGIGVVCLPLVPDDPCGDGWDVIQSGDRTVILVVDGLGHGPEASKVQVEAVRCFRKNPTGEPAEILMNLHAALRSTRGGVLAVAALDEGKGRVTYAGAGNISGRIITGPDTRKMVSLDGTAGYEIKKFQEFSYPWAEGALLIMYSDGLSMHWDMENYPGLRQKHPSLIAGVLFRDHTRGSDDVTVLVIKRVEVTV